MPNQRVSPPTGAADRPTELRVALIAGLSGLIAGAICLHYPQNLSVALRTAFVSMAMMVAGSGLVLGWRPKSIRVTHLSLLMCWLFASMALLAAASAGTGVHSIALGALSLLTCLLSVAAGRRAGVALAAASAVGVLTLAGAQQAGWIWVAHPPLSPPSVAVAVHLLLIGIGLGGGLTIHGRIQLHLTALHEREERLRGLLHIAADWYWETDALMRFTHITRDAGLSPPTPAVVSASDLIGRPLWDAPLEYSDDALDAYRADIEAHRPIVNVVGHTDRTDGRRIHMSISGMPRFAPDRRFLGYWGLARDVSAEIQARQALSVSETRYRELFNRSLSPLVVHRAGRVIEANAAALELFGYPDAAAMVGIDLLAHYENIDNSLARGRERMRQLEALPVGASLPVTDFVLRSRHGRRFSVRGTGVRVEAESGLATLSIFFDETDRLSAENAVRRSESLLSNLVATSPDVITLTELGSGRYAMVNDTFTRLTGYTRAEVIGRTALEIGIWQHLADREHMVAALRESGLVQAQPANFVGKSGQVLPMLISAARFQMDGRDYVVINGRDVSATERTRLEYAAMLENASIGIAFTRDRIFVQVNARFENMFGWAEGTLVGQHGRSIWHEAESTPVGEEVSRRLALGLAVELEQQMVRRDGSAFWCRLLAKAVDPTHPGLGGTIWIAEDISERRRVAENLALAYDAAEAANRAKSAFLANTSHEIRTPLNGILGLARLLQQPDLPAAQRRQYINQVVDSAQSLAGIIDDILDLSKIEAGKLTLETVAFHLPDTMGALHRTYLTLARARGLDLQLQLDSVLPSTVQGDPVRLRQILGNFLANALKFTREGEVMVRVFARRDDLVRFEVQDTGPGIDDTTRARLFQPFTQADDSTTRRYGGTGLGLSICRELAHLMHGKVGVLSEPGHGSLFWAEIPLPPAGEDEKIATDFGALQGEDRDSPLHGAHVLVVEDNPVNMLICVAVLEQCGVRVAQAEDGPSAIAKVEHAQRDGDPFDAVLMDVQMPLMSGHEAARVLRQRYDAHALPIIALTAAALVSERDQALAAGMNDFLTKPLEPVKLLRTLSHALADARA